MSKAILSWLVYAVVIWAVFPLSLGRFAVAILGVVAYGFIENLRGQDQ